MKIGVIGYSNNSGLGNYISNFRKHIPFDSQFIIRHPEKGTFDVSIPNSLGSMEATEEQLAEYLAQHTPDIVIIIETPFNNDFYQLLHAAAVKIVYIPMIDCISVNIIKSFKPYISVVINHTTFGHDVYKDAFGDKAYHIPYPVDSEYYHPDKVNGKRKYDFTHSQGFGGAGFRKATDQIFLAFRQAQYTHPDIKMLINSQPHCHNQLLRKSTNVTIKVQDCLESIDLYRDSNVYVAPSRREGLGLPMLEAMACGLPVITTDAPPMNEWFDNDTLLVPVQHQEDLPYGDIPMATPNPFELMQKMIYAYEHPKHMQRIGKANRKIIEEKYCWNALKDRYLEVFEGLLK